MLKRVLLAAFFLVGFSEISFAQQSVLPCYRTTTGCTDVSAANPQPVTSLPAGGTANLITGTNSAAMTGTTSTQLIALSTGNKLYITHISCVNSHATVGTFVTVQDGSGGTALMTLAAAAVYGGDEATSSLPLFATSAGNGLYVANVTNGANVFCNASGYKGP